MKKVVLDENFGLLEGIVPSLSELHFFKGYFFALQVMGKVPTISIDKTDGCQMFLSKDSIDVEIITAKSSEMNVMIPNGEDFVSVCFILSQAFCRIPNFFEALN